MLILATTIAAGFAITEQNTAALGQANAVAARADDSSAVYYNPAGLAGQKGWRVLVGDTVIAPFVTADLPDGRGLCDGSPRCSALPKTFFPPHLYASYGTSDWGVGIGINAPFGLGIGWKDNWPGQFDTRSINLQVIEGSVAGGYKLGPVLVGAAIRFLDASVDYRRGINFYSDTYQAAEAHLVGSGTGLGVALSALAPINKDLTVGFTYRSRVTTDITGKIHYANVPGSFQAYLKDGGATSSVTFPDQVLLGGEYRVNKDFTVSAQADYTAWQTFESFDVTLDQPCQAGPPCQSSISSPRNWHHSLTGRLGGEYQLGKYRVRAGALFDEGASPTDTLSPSLPDSSRVAVTVGGGMDLPKGLSADVALAYVLGMPVTADGVGLLPATYNFSALLLGVTIGYGGHGR